MNVQLRMVVLSFAVSVFFLTGSQTLAGQSDGGVNPVKTCGVGPTKDIVAIDQLWDVYAHNLDAGDAEGVANLFTTMADISFYTTTARPKL
jgi:hypothetical protein